MKDRQPEEESEMKSHCGAMHKQHMCVLEKTGVLNPIRRRQLTHDPRVYCSKCGAKAHYPHSLCFPVALDE